MTLGDMKLLCSLCLVAGVVTQHVTYPDPLCAVKGSTLTLGCTFKPRALLRNLEGSKGFWLINRVVWCQNHEICHGSTPSVYDSRSQRNNPKYHYLGNMKDNCTLQIQDIAVTDSAVYRFRMEADHVDGHFTGRSGVTVSVIEKQKDVMVIVAVTAGVLLPVVLLIVAVIIIKRKHTAAASKPHRIVGKMEEKKHLEHIYGNMEQPGRQEEPAHQHEAGQAVENVSYACVQFRPNTESRQKMEPNDVVYTSVASKG
ncbi:uncharacterized protein LOC117505802 [Thalassophryne amazonica]|uniref:uncharacterized protein LOC117505802 n=1 Tax=Thalassophryne amazonica TaxID=390379 RepID=UPI0014708831|nr:uncharacterized protein LOC117505802 [Thalassophryne amazonica]